MNDLEIRLHALLDERAGRAASPSTDPVAGVRARVAARRRRRVAVRAGAAALLLVGAGFATRLFGTTTAQIAVTPRPTPSPSSTAAVPSAATTSTTGTTSTPGAVSSTPATFPLGPLVPVDVLTSFVDTDPTWRARHAVPSSGGHVLCDVAPYARADGGRTVYAETLCQEFVGTATGVHVVSGSQAFLTAHLRTIGTFVIGVDSVDSPDDASLQAYVATLPAAVRAVIYAVPHTFVDGPDGNAAERAAVELSAGTLPRSTEPSGSPGATGVDLRELRRTQKLPFPTTVFGVTTLWHGTVNGLEMLIDIGGPKSPEGRSYLGGGVRIETDQNVIHGTGSASSTAPQIYADRSLSGPLTAAGEFTPNVLTLVAADGRTVTFDLVRRRLSTQ